MAYEHPSGLPNAFDRLPTTPERARLIWPEGVFLQGADLNELASLEARRNRRVGNMSATDGDRINGADIVIDAATHTLYLSSGSIYISGDVRPVEAAAIEGISLSGDVKVGVRLQKTLVTYEDDPSLLGLLPGSEAYGQPGAARENETIVWALSDDDQDGDFFLVYLIRDGAVLDQTGPMILSGVQQMISLYDVDAHGSYVVNGCEVTALGKISGSQVFSVQAGVANIQGFKRSREYALRHAEPEDPDLEDIAAEPHTYPVSDPAVIPVNLPPIASVAQVLVVKSITESVVRGSTAGGSDLLAHAPISITSVVQGVTTFSPSAYAIDGNAISWAPAGSEPIAASTYDVTYRYYAAVTPSAISDTAVTVSGGIAGTTALITYSSKIPRVDILCLDRNGATAYIKGISARKNGVPPIAPSTLLKLAEVRNSWMGAPAIENNATASVPYDLLWRYLRRVRTILEQFDRVEARLSIAEADPVAKTGVFTDAFADDSYRDDGEVQSAAIANSCLQLAVSMVGIFRFLVDPVTMAFDEEVVVAQEFYSSAMLINPYASLSRMPSGIRLSPAVDFWTEQVTAWASPVTQQFATTAGTSPSQTSFNEVVSVRQAVARFLRQISVTAFLEGFGGGENLATLTFDGVNVKPAGTQTADSNGDLSVTFTIPAGIPAGRRRVRATGAAGSFAETIFVGEGTIDVTTLRRVTLVARAAPQPPVTTVNNGGGGGADGGGNGSDPLAQTFAVDRDRFIIGVDFRIAEIGDPTRGLRVQVATTENGIPTGNVLAEVFISLATVSEGDWIEARFDAPVFLSGLREYCFVILTDDPDHKVSVAKIGDVFTDPVTGTQSFISQQVYTVGVLLASANRSTWTPVQEADMAFRIVAAKFTQTTRTVTLGTLALDTCSDLIIRATADIPTADASVSFEVVRADGTVIPCAIGQTISFDDFVTETVTIKAILTGTEDVAPVLYPGVTVVVGRLETTGTYVTRAWAMGTAVDTVAIMAASLPAGSSLAVACDNSDDSWQTMSLVTTGTLLNGWVEPKYRKDPFTAATGRLKLTLTGTPAARPRVANLRAYTI